MKPILLLSVLLCISAGAVAAADALRVDWTMHVRPVLISRCINCHHSGAMFGQLSLENRAMAFHERAGGPVILPGRPDSSPLYQVLRMPPKDLKAMPPSGHRITDREMSLIYDWIKQGATWPEGKAGILKPMKSREKEDT